MSIKKIYPVFFLLFVFFSLPDSAYAELSCCTAQGGAAYCDYATSKLYCKDGTVSTECACRAADTPTPAPSPTFTPAPTSAPPLCPSHSSLDASGGVCKCTTGYIVNANSCVSYAEYCWSQYGGNSYYDTTKADCSCLKGYTLNKEGSSCIAFSDLCHNTFGDKSYYNSDNNSCTCFQGYAMQNNQCQVIPTQKASTPQTISAVILTSTPVPSPTAVTVTGPSVNPARFSINNVVPTGIKKELLGVHTYVTVKKPQPNIFEQIVTNIWHFLLIFF